MPRCPWASDGLRIAGKPTVICSGWLITWNGTFPSHSAVKAARMAFLWLQTVAAWELTKWGIPSRSLIRQATGMARSEPVEYTASMWFSRICLMTASSSRMLICAKWSAASAAGPSFAIATVKVSQPIFLSSRTASICTDATPNIRTFIPGSSLQQKLFITLLSVSQTYSTSSSDSSVWIGSEIRLR